MGKAVKYLGIIDYLQYFYLYCMICFGGMSTPFRMSNDTFLLFILISSSFIILLKGTSLKKLTSKIVTFLCILFVSLVLVMLTAPLTLGTSLSIILVIEICYATYLLNPKKFLSRLVLLILLLASFSLIMYAMTLYLGFDAMVNLCKPISTPVFSSVREQLYSYNFYIYNLVYVHSDRNCGPFGEPGQYQCVLTSVLFFLLFYPEKINIKCRFFSIGILIATILTTQSTTGYISFVILVVCYYSYSCVTAHVDKRILNIFKLSILVIVLFILFTDLGESFLQTTIYNKFDFEKKEILASGGARTEGIYSALNLIASHPEVLWGIGFDNTLLNVRSESGFLIYLLAIGFLPFSILYGYLLFLAFYFSHHKFESFAKILLVLNMSLGQPHIMNPVLFLIILYPFFIKKSKFYENNLDYVY